MTSYSRSLARAGHEGMVLSPCPPLWYYAEESCQRQDSSWDLLLAWIIHLKLWSHFPSPMAPFCHLYWGGLPRSPAETIVALATEQGSGQGRKNLNWIVLALFTWCIEAHTIWKSHLLCLCVLAFVRVCVCYAQRDLTLIQASFASGWILINSKAVSCPCWLQWEALDSTWRFHICFTYHIC